MKPRDTKLRWKKHLTTKILTCKQNSEIRSMFNSVLGSAELTSAEQRFDKRMVHSALRKKKTSTESNQTTLQKSCHTERGDHLTECGKMPVGVRPKFSQNSAWHSSQKKIGRTCLWSEGAIAQKLCLQVHGTSRTTTDIARTERSHNHRV